jgi:hypothetical protein
MKDASILIGLTHRRRTRIEVGVDTANVAEGHAQRAQRSPDNRFAAAVRIGTVPDQQERQLRRTIGWLHE